MKNEVKQQVEFSARQIEGRAVTSRDSRHRVQAECARPDCPFSGRCWRLLELVGTAELRAHTRLELFYSKGLRDVIVGTGIKPEHTIAFARACRQQHDGLAVVAGSQAPAN